MEAVDALINGVSILKNCSKCKTAKPLVCFSKNKRMSDGYNNNCKECIKSYRKIQVSKDEAIKFQKEQTELGTLFKCKGCQEDKLADQFYTKRDYNKVTINTSKCRSCQTEYQRIKTFGICDVKYQEMLESQDNLCKICKIHIDDYTSTSNRNKRFAVDHCHSTGAIRGLLCSKCNQAIGLLNDDITILQNAILYLKGNDMV
tara:strand:- start:77252 stop:77857 length:606 start_codon:yes stop_codon:yes gene_type:complete